MEIRNSRSTSFISKQNRSDQLFEFQTEEKIFPSWCRTSINKPPLRYHRRDLRCLQQSTCKHLQQQNHFLQAIQKLRFTFPCPKKIYTTEAAMDDKNSLSRGQSKKQCLPRSREDQNKNTRAMPTAKYWVFKATLLSALFTQ